ncbi:50S ribosomal protein L5 [archaeon]|nr:50S ribosomal protein L5 [archaeon]
MTSKNDTQENPMRKIRISKVTLSIALKESGENVEKAYTLAERLTGLKPVRTLATRKARTFRLRRGLPIGVKVTLRNKKSMEFLKNVLVAKENKLTMNNFDNEGNFGFGVSEYLDVPGQKYDPKIGMLGFNVNVSLERPGFRIKRRKIQKRKLSINHRILKNDAIDFATKEVGIKIKK